MTDGSSHDDVDGPADADGTELTHDEPEALRDDPDADPSDPALDDEPRDESFDRRDGEELDGDRLWARLETDDPDASDSEITSRSADREVRDVEKRSYCHGCEHFADPPAIACTRDGSEILAVPSMTTFRVADCPFVLEDEALEQSD